MIYLEWCTQVSKESKLSNQRITAEGVSVNEVQPCMCLCRTVLVPVMCADQHCEVIMIVACIKLSTYRDMPFDLLKTKCARNHMPPPISKSNHTKQQSRVPPVAGFA